MTDEELKNKCTERAKIFQQAMESCHSSNPMDCIEWFADRITELEKENAELKQKYDTCLRENTGLKIHSAYVEKKLTKAKEIIKKLYAVYYDPCVTESDLKYRDELFAEIKQFLKE